MSSPLTVFPSQCLPLSISFSLNIIPSQCFLFSMSTPLNIFLSPFNMFHSQYFYFSIFFSLNVLSSQHLSSQCLLLSMSSPLNVFSSQCPPLPILPLSNLNISPSQNHPLSIFFSLNVLSQCFSFSIYFLLISFHFNVFPLPPPLKPQYFSLSISFSFNILPFQCLSLLISSTLNVFFF